MLQIVAGETLSDLAERLADILSVPLADPMTPELVVVPTAGVDRWLRLELSKFLGTSGPGRTDGIVANTEFAFPGSFKRRVASSVGNVAKEENPWDVSRLAWTVLEALDENDTDAVLDPVVRLAEGATRWAKARQIADLFDRYLLHRPQMVDRWELGEDVDAWGSALPYRALWQPHLWRLVAEAIAEPSPAVGESEIIQALSLKGPGPDFPARVSLFGLGSVPGGTPFLEMLDALGCTRDVHLLLHQPSIAMARSVRPVDQITVGELRRRGEGPSGSPTNRLLETWGRPSVETLVLLGDRQPEPADELVARQASSSSELTLLKKLQADLRSDLAPAADFVPSVSDTSIRIHSCHGPSRQVEVLRDQILHLLAQDSTLSEDDIVVLCPTLEEYVPLIERRWGLSAAGNEESNSAGAPRLRYQVADRSLGSLVPLLGDLVAIVELLDSRFSAAAVLNLMGLQSIREKFGFTDDEIEIVARWVEGSNTRWGTTPEQRQRWHVPEVVKEGTWSAMLDRLLMGVAISDHEGSLGPNQTLPIQVEGSDILLAGRLADLVARLSLLVEEVVTARPIWEWVELLRRIASEFLAVNRENEWQEAKLRAVLERIIQDATTRDRVSDIALDYRDLRVLLGRYLQAAAGRADFFRGGITISSLTPLRGIPYRVVCLLGMDEKSFGVGAPDGDDLVAMSPAVGDRDRRSDTRAALLDAVLSAQSHLIMTRNGHSVITNQPVPASVAISELRDVISGSIALPEADAAMARLEVVHPRQSFDERNYVQAAVDGAIAGPWSFDDLGRISAEHRRTPQQHVSTVPIRIDEEDLTTIELADIRDFLKQPVRHFLRSQMGISLPDPDSRSGVTRVEPTTGLSGAPRAAAGSELELELSSLDRWALWDRVLRSMQNDMEFEDAAAREKASGSLPPGRLGDSYLEVAEILIDALIAKAEEVGVGARPTASLSIDIHLPVGIRIVGSASDGGGHLSGPITITPSEFDESKILDVWLDLLVLSVMYPSEPWQGSLISRGKKTVKKVDIPIGVGTHIQLVGDSAEQRKEAAIGALSTVVDLFLRAQREPLPIFAKSSALVARDKSGKSKWEGGFNSVPGECVNEWTKAAFGDLTYKQLQAMELQSWDVEGPGDNRFERYARVLWGAYDDSTMKVPAPEVVSP